MSNFDISHEIAWLTCQKCKMEELDTEVAFAEYLHKTYWECKTAIDKLEECHIANSEPVKIV